MAIYSIYYYDCYLNSLIFTPSVLSWDGGQNHVDKELEEERLNKKRSWADDYNDELDAGKVTDINIFISFLHFSCAVRV